MGQYAVEVEFGTDYSEEVAERLALAFDHMGASAHRNDHDNAAVRLTVDAESVAGAAALVEEVGSLAGAGEIVAITVMDAADADARGGPTGEERDAVSVTEAAAMLGISRQRVHQLVQEGRLPATRIGHSYAISRADVHDYGRTRPEVFLPF